MTSVLTESTTKAGPKPLTEGPQARGVLIALYAFVIVPFLAVLVAVPVAWGGWLSWTDIAIGAVFYVVTGLGITVGFHRFFTHGSSNRPSWNFSVRIRRTASLIRPIEIMCERTASRVALCH